MSPVLIIVKCTTELRKLTLDFQNLKAVKIEKCAFADEVEIFARNKIDL